VVMQSFDVDRPLTLIRTLPSETLLATRSPSKCPLHSLVNLRHSVPRPPPPVSTLLLFPTFLRNTSTILPTLETAAKTLTTTAKTNDSSPLLLSVPTLPSRRIPKQEPLLLVVENRSPRTIRSPLPILVDQVEESHSEMTVPPPELVSFNATLRDIVLVLQTRSLPPTFNRQDPIFRTEREEEHLYHQERRLLVIRCPDSNL